MLDTSALLGDNMTVLYLQLALRLPNSQKDKLLLHMVDQHVKFIINKIEKIINFDKQNDFLN